MYKFQHKIINHPTFVFIFTWLIVVLISSFKLLDIFALYLDEVYLIVITIIFFNLFGFLFSLVVFKNNFYNRYIFTKPYIKNYKKLLYFWIIVTIIEIIYSKGLPLQWLLVSNGRTYDEFGIGTVHGLANAIYLFITFTVIFKDNKSTNDKVFLVFLLVWPILVVSRALLTIVILQGVFYYFSISEKKLSYFIYRGIIGFVFFMMLFGFLGNYRSEGFSVLSAFNIADEGQIFQAIYLWFYVYLVSPIANFAMNLIYTEPSYTLFPHSSFSMLIPSVIRSALGFDSGFFLHTPMVIHNAFNVTTAFIYPYRDWGYFGFLVFTFLLGFIGHIVWGLSSNGRLLPLLAFYNSCIVLTVFTNQFLQLMPVFYFMLLYLFSKVTYQKCNPPKK